MNAVTSVFPEATQFLCSWHIDRNVMAKCKEKFDTDEKWKKFFYGSWKSVMDSSTEEEFANVLQSFHNDYADVPIECEAYHYCMNQWIYPYKEKFVAAWTNKVMHYENRTTNRVESHHSALKKSLGNSMRNFESCWKRVDTLYQASHNAVKASFEKSGIVIMHKLRGVIFKDLLGLVSEYALEKIYAELQGIPKGKLDPQICDHFLRNVCGLPCTHELHEYKRLVTSIPLEVVDKFWRKLDMKPTLNSENNIKDEVVGDIDSRFEEKIEELKRQYEKGELSKKRVILRQLNELNHPSTTSMVELAPKTTTRGRPKASLSKKKEYASTKRDPSFFEYKQSVPFRGPVLSNNTVILDVPDKCSATQKPKKKLQVSRKRDFTDLLPIPFRPFILECRDVVPDGHCGFRAVAALMGIGEENWAEVRRGMMNELSRNIKLYMRVFKEELMVDEISNALNCFTTPAPLANWFQLPYMGYLVASLYNVVVIVLSRMSLTFLPLRTAPPETPKSICIGLVNNNHFIQVFLKPDRQLPPVADSWHQTKLITAEGWLEAYVNNRIR